MSEENKACPLCGEKAIEGYNEEEMKYTFECHPCGLILTGDCEVKETEKIWNNRQPDPRIKELIDKINERLDRSDSRGLLLGVLTELERLI
jgi:hypothetical protein